MKIKLNSVLISVSDIMRAKPFYENVFGVEFSEVRPPFSCFTMSGIEFNIEENSPERAPGWVEKYIGTIKPISFKVDNVDDFLKRVVDNGGKIITKPITRPWGWKDGEFSDLDGNVFIVEQEL